ncbi:enoyl-CoA hydratase-related protein, partial [Aphanothece microscopica]|uniref:enoyl-CoA hydratase-related protein n=1 Tax=Aphanothece microscopica TaxID=1049561 RepID=UPI00398560EE
MTLAIDRLDGGVLRLTLDRPQAANALSRAMQDALVATLAEAAGDPATRAVLLTGAGGRVFSAGADLRED